jgi:hypothetical protein
MSMSAWLRTGSERSARQQQAFARPLPPDHVPDPVLLTVLSCPFYGVTPISAGAEGHHPYAVKEGVGPGAVSKIAALKKDAMAKRAEALLKGKGWLPQSCASLRRGYGWLRLSRPRPASREAETAPVRRGSSRGSPKRFWPAALHTGAQPAFSTFPRTLPIRHM